MCIPKRIEIIVSQSELCCLITTVVLPIENLSSVLISFIFQRVYGQVYKLWL